MRNLRTAALSVLAAAVLIGCGDDNGSGPDDGPTRTLVYVDGSGQVGAVGAALPKPLIVRVEDESGNPVADVTVTWSLDFAAGAGSSLSDGPIHSTSGADGQTSISFSLGDAAGTYKVRASITGSTVIFTEEATATGAIQIVSGSGQVGLTAAALPQDLVVRAVGTGGADLPGVEVTFAVIESQGAGAAVVPTAATTNASGLASTTLTLGDTNGPVVVSASANGSTVQFTAYACGGDAAASAVDLAPGEDAVITGAGAACVQLPAHSAGAEYEVTVTPLPQTLGFNAMALGIAGSAASPPSGAVRAPARAAFSLLGGTPGLADWRASQYEWDRQLRELEAPLRPQIRAAAASGGGFGLMAAPPQVGDTLDFGFSCVTSTQFPNAPSSITAEVIQVSSNAVILEDTLARGSFTPAEYAAISQNFDDVIIGTDTLYFGAPGDATGDIAPGQVLIVYTAGVNRMTEDYTQGFIAGFFCPLDLIGFGNDAKMFYLLVPDQDGDFTPGDDANILTKTNVLRITDNTVAHEFQHLINAQLGTGAAQDVWLNEGLSHLAEEVVGHAAAQAAGLARFAPGNEIEASDIFTSQASVEVFNRYYINNWVNLALYLAQPSDTAALLNSEDPLGMNTFRMRGTAWSFVRYALDRFGAPATEWQLTRQLIVDGAATSREAVTNVFGVPFNDVAADWSAMFAIEDRTDLGGAVRPALGLTSWRVRDIYDDPSIGPVISPTGDYPLDPLIRSLGGSSSVDLDLFTATAEYVTLRASAATGGTGLRLMSASGADLSAAVAPYMVIVRTK